MEVLPYSLRLWHCYRALKLDACEQSDAWRLDCRRRAVHCRRTRRVQRHATSVPSATLIRFQVYACFPSKCSGARQLTSIPVLSKCSTDIRYRSVIMPARLSGKTVRSPPSNAGRPTELAANAAMTVPRGTANKAKAQSAPTERALAFFWEGRR